MTKQQADQAADDFFLDDLDTADQAELVITKLDGSPSGWKWFIAGPGHPQAVALSNRLNKEAFDRERAQEIARVNGKKWKGDDESADAALRRRVEMLAGRVIGWTPIKLTRGGDDYPYSPENCVELLLHSSRGPELIRQLSDFLTDSRSFTTRSAKG